MPAYIVWLVETVEDGLGAAHRGVILGCDGSNRYIAALYICSEGGLYSDIKVN